MLKLQVKSHYYKFTKILHYETTQNLLIPMVLPFLTITIKGINETKKIVLRSQNNCRVKYLTDNRTLAAIMAQGFKTGT